MIENQLVRSIDEAKQQKAQRGSSLQDSPAAPTSANAQVVQQPSNITALTTVGQTGLSLLLAGCMTAAIDGAVLARDYAHSKGLTLALSEESIQDLATSLLIHVQRMAELECKYDIKANAAANRMAQSGGVAWRRKPLPPHSMTQRRASRLSSIPRNSSLRTRSKRSWPISRPRSSRPRS
jgi:hypothetical protein